MKSWTNVKFSIDLAATNYKKSMHIISDRFFFPEFHNQKFGMCIIYECMLYTTNYSRTAAESHEAAYYIDVVS